ncbi:hypothetical protein RRSWK_01229 [Rhodopirellula sp. SWK7]|nr:hypothetical protein RRSWK_01229 [Rhodopirellula sp. SWK7]
MDKPLGTAIVEFDRTAPDADSTSEAQPNATDQKAEERVRRCPQYAKDEEQVCDQ